MHTPLRAIFLAAGLAVGATPPCIPLPPSTGPLPHKNTLAGFLAESVYSKIANKFPIPSDYQAVALNQNATVDSSRYMGYFNLNAYSPKTCAELCSYTPGCDAFNVYFQRNPSINPDAACPNPTAHVLARCALYSEPVRPDQISNFGQGRGPADKHGVIFQTAIRGSNVYNKVPSLPKKITVTVAETKLIPVTVPVTISVTVPASAPSNEISAAVPSPSTDFLVSPAGSSSPAATFSAPAVIVPIPIIPSIVQTEGQPSVTATDVLFPLPAPTPSSPLPDSINTFLAPAPAPVQETSLLTPIIILPSPTPDFLTSEPVSTLRRRFSLMTA